MASFLTVNPIYGKRGWEGFAGVFRHNGDTCAGNSTVVTETVSTTFSVFVGSSNRQYDFAVCVCH